MVARYTDNLDFHFRYFGRAHGADSLIFVRGSIAVAVLSTFLVTLAPNAAAETCPAMAGTHPATANLDAEARLRFIEGRLRKARRYAKIWNRSWSLGFLATSAVYFGATPFFDDPDQESFQASLYVGGGKALIAGAFGFVRPLKVFSVKPKDQSLCARLAAAEKALRLTARKEKKMKGWAMWVAGFALNMAGLAVLGAMGHWQEAAVSAAIGIPVGQIRIWSQPTVAHDTLQAYRVGRIGGASTSGTSITFGPGPGMGLSVRFER